MSLPIQEETASEHIRNAQQLLRDVARDMRILHFHEFAAAIEAADLRLTQALTAIKRNHDHV